MNLVGVAAEWTDKFDSQNQKNWGSCPGIWQPTSGSLKIL